MTPKRTSIEALIAVLEAENLALASMDLAAAHVLLPEKNRLVEAAKQLALANDTQGDRSMGDAIRRLAELAELNKLAIEKAMLVQRHVTSLVAAATRKAEPTRGYGQRGRGTNTARAEAYAVLSLA